MKNDKLIEDNMTLVYYLVKRYYPKFLFDEDIIQCGMVGLVKAAQSWDESKSKFSSYSSFCILNEIRQEFIRRSKYSTDTSLEKNVCEHLTLGEVLVGDEDVSEFNLDALYSKLTDKEKEVFDLKLAGYKQKEIAERIGCTQQGVSYCMGRIKSKMEECYED